MSGPRCGWASGRWVALAAETQGLVAPECPEEREESGLEEGFSELWEQGKQQTQEVGRAGWVLGRQACRREGGQELAVGGNQLGRVEKALDLGCALKVEPTSLADGLNVSYKYYKESRMTPWFSTQPTGGKETLSLEEKIQEETQGQLVCRKEQAPCLGHSQSYSDGIYPCRGLGSFA